MIKKNKIIKQANKNIKMVKTIENDKDNDTKVLKQIENSKMCKTIRK